MQIPPFLTVIYAGIFLIMLVMAGFFVAIFRKMQKKLNHSAHVVEKASTLGLTPAGIHALIQSQVLELQATDTNQPEHGLRFSNLVDFLKESKMLLHTEAPMLELYILRLETAPSSDTSHLPTLAALFSWSQSRSKTLLNATA